MQHHTGLGLPNGNAKCSESLHAALGDGRLAIPNAWQGSLPEADEVHER